MPDLATAPGELPEPSAELVMLRVLVEAHVASMPRKKSERFLRMVAEKLAEEEALSAVFHIRPQTQRARLRISRRQAAEWYRCWLPTFVARMRDD